MKQKTKGNEHNIEQSFNTLIEKATRIQNQFEVNDLFEKNMNAFKKHVPQIYIAYQKYQAKRFKVGSSESGNLNLYDITNSQPVYPVKDVEEFCQSQVEAFIKNPVCCQTNIIPSNNDKFFHNCHLKLKINQDYLSYQGDIKAPIGLIYIMGVGLAYHLPKLLKRLDIRHICLFEPNPDAFFSSLLTIDWGPILKTYSKNNYSLNFFINQTPTQCLSGVKRIIPIIGSHNMVNSFYYQHLKSEAHQAIYQCFKHQFDFLSAGLGNLEDEMISMKHTLENIKNKTPLLKDEAKLGGLPPAMIIANGPSLDKNIHFINQHKNKCILFSCGSTLTALEKIGIKPDFHIETERTGAMAKVIKKGTSKAFRQGITCLGLNTISPHLLSLFDKKGIILKANDVGASIIVKDENCNDTPLISYCNPTVSNTALSIANHFGFKNIFLIGVDLGVIDAKNHHSKNSGYYDKKNETLTINKEQPFNIPVKGNFRDVVTTNQVLNFSRKMIEQLIMTNKDLIVFNLSDGAYIKGSLPYDEKEITIDDFICPNNKAEKDKLTSLIYDYFFRKKELKKPINDSNIKEKILKNCLQFLSSLKFSEEIKTNIGMQEYLDEIQQFIYSKNNDDVFKHLIRDGLSQLINIYYKNFLLMDKSNETALKTLNDWANEYLNTCHTLLKTNPLQVESL